MTTETHAPQIERWHEPDIDRYVFDFCKCHYKNGWAQCDTDQDASYFGEWANPFELRTVTYAEGDVIVTTAHSPEEFAEEIRRMATFHREDGGKFAIDGMCEDRIIQRFQSLGLADLLH